MSKRKAYDFNKAAAAVAANSEHQNAKLAKRLKLAKIKKSETKEIASLDMSELQKRLRF